MEQSSEPRIKVEERTPPEHTYALRYKKSRRGGMQLGVCIDDDGTVIVADIHNRAHAELLDRAISQKAKEAMLQVLPAAVESSMVQGVHTAVNIFEHMELSGPTMVQLPSGIGRVVTQDDLVAIRILFRKRLVELSVPDMPKPADVPHA